MNWQGRGSISTHSLLAASHTPKWGLKSLTPKLIFLKMVKRCLQAYPMQNMSQGKGPQKSPQDLARNPRRLAFHHSYHPIACPEKPLMVPQLYTALERFRQPLMLRCLYTQRCLLSICYVCQIFIPFPCLPVEPHIRAQIFCPV